MRGTTIGRLPETMTARSNVFLAEGDYWTLGYRGKTVRMRSSNGLRYIARLLAEPGREVHVLELVSLPGDRGGTAGKTAASLASDGLRIGDHSDAGEILDPQARDAYRRRLADLEEDLAESERNNDAGRTANVRAEMQALEQQLSQAFGLGGRARRSGSAAERARVNVRNSIAATLKAIRPQHSELAEHLAKAVRTGAFCWYASEGVTWRTEAPPTEPAPRTEPTKTTLPAGALSLMIVDDHPMWRQTLRAVLEGSGTGVVVAEAADGGQAVELAAETRPDAVVMDMNLIHVNGVEATQRLLEIVPDTKVLMLSSSDERADVIEAVKAGASGYLLKTAEPGEVADAVRRVAAGELVFPPALANVVLQEFRRLGRRVPAKRAQRKR